MHALQIAIVCNQSNNVTTDCHSQMMNVTARLATRIRYMPDFPFDWSDSQRQCQSLTADDYLPSTEDASAIEESGVQYLMGFLADNFDDLTIDNIDYVTGIGNADRKFNT